LFYSLISLGSPLSEVSRGKCLIEKPLTYELKDAFPGVIGRRSPSPFRPEGVGCHLFFLLTSGVDHQEAEQIKALPPAGDLKIINNEFVIDSEP
jgi:hypothetical protein